MPVGLAVASIGGGGRRPGGTMTRRFPAPGARPVLQDVERRGPGDAQKVGDIVLSGAKRLLIKASMDVVP